MSALSDAPNIVRELFHITTCYNRGDSESTILAFQEWKEYEDKVKNNLPTSSSDNIFQKGRI